MTLVDRVGCRAQLHGDSVRIVRFLPALRTGEQRSGPFPRGCGAARLSPPCARAVRRPSRRGCPEGVLEPDCEEPGEADPRRAPASRPNWRSPPAIGRTRHRSLQANWESVTRVLGAFASPRPGLASPRSRPLRKPEHCPTLDLDNRLHCFRRDASPDVKATPEPSRVQLFTRQLHTAPCSCRPPCQRCRQLPESASIPSRCNSFCNSHTEGAIPIRRITITQSFLHSQICDTQVSLPASGKRQRLITLSRHVATPGSSGPPEIRSTRTSTTPPELPTRNVALAAQSATSRKQV